MTINYYIWTQKAEDKARALGLEERKAGTTACLGCKPLEPGEVANAWIAKGYVTSPRVAGVETKKTGETSVCDSA